MVLIKIVPKEDMAVLKRYLSKEPNVILVPEDVLCGMSGANQKAIRTFDNQSILYGFGGEADYHIDLMESADSYSAQALLGLVDGGAQFE